MAGIFKSLIDSIDKDINAKRIAEERKKLEPVLEHARKYDEARANANIPSPVPPIVTVIEHLRGYVYIYWKYYIWLDDGILKYFPAPTDGKSSTGNGYYKLSESKFIVNEIPVDRILFYKQVGEVYTTVSGSGGNSSFSLMTGFHGKINPVNITSNVHDERSTQLFYDDGNKDCVLVFAMEDYYTLRRILEEKDYEFVNRSKAFENNFSSADEIRKFKSLLDDGIITVEEFEKKKKQLLSL